MSDLIVSVPDHYLSFYFPYFLCANGEGSGETARIAGSPEPSLVAYVISTIISANLRILRDIQILVCQKKKKKK